MYYSETNFWIRFKFAGILVNKHKFSATRSPLFKFQKNITFTFSPIFMSLNYWQNEPRLNNVVQDKHTFVDVSQCHVRMCSLHDMHEINARRAERVFLSVCLSA